MDSRVSFKEKLAYGLGDAGCNFVWTTISAFLTLYYTDNVGISALVVGNIMLLTRLLDGVTDIIMGVIIDKTKTRWGKARPWILFSALPMAIGLILLFNVPSGLSESGKTTYAFITYLFVAAFAYTACNLSYTTLLALAAPNQKDRTSMSSIRFICTSVTVTIISYSTMNIIGKIGWSGMSFVYGGIAIILLLITFFGTKERAVPINSLEKEKLDVKAAVKILFKNKYFISTTLIFIANYAASGIFSGSAIYYARDVLGNVGLFGTISIVRTLPTIIGLPFFPQIAAKFGKWKSILGGYTIIAIGSVIMIISPESATAILAGLFVKGFGLVPLSAGLFAMIGDVIDYGEWKTGYRVDGLTNSAVSFGMKVGVGLGTALTGWMLAFGKYDANLSVQGASAILSMKAMYIYIPLVLYLIGAILLYFTNIDKIYPEMKKDLEQRRENA